MQIAAIIFSIETRTLFTFNDNQTHASLNQKIEDAPYLRSFTNIYNALHVANTDIYQLRYGDRLEIKDVIILITGTCNTLTWSNKPHTTFYNNNNNNYETFILHNLTTEPDYRLHGTNPRYET